MEEDGIYYSQASSTVFLIWSEPLISIVLYDASQLIPLEARFRIMVMAIYSLEYAQVLYMILK